MTKLNYVFVISILSMIVGAVLLDFYGRSFTSGVLIIGGGVIGTFSGFFTLLEKN